MDFDQMDARRPFFKSDLQGSQVWAIKKDTGLRVYMPDGARNEPASLLGDATWAELANAGELLCPFCRKSFGCAVGPDNRRHHFRHRPGDSNHPDRSSQMTLWHWTAEQVVAEWARDEFPSAAVRVDDTQLSIPSGTYRKPDVLIDDGKRRLAVECQYSSLEGYGEHGWRRRRDDYAAIDVLDIWLLINSGPQVKVSRGRGGRIRLLGLHKAMLHAGVVPMWLDPFTGTVATAQHPDRANLPPNAWSKDCLWGEDMFATCSVDLLRRELITPTRELQQFRVPRRKRVTVYQKVQPQSHPVEVVEVTDPLPQPAPPEVVPEPRRKPNPGPARRVHRPPLTSGVPVQPAAVVVPSRLRRLFAWAYQKIVE